MYGGYSRLEIVDNVLILCRENLELYICISINVQCT